MKDDGGKLPDAVDVDSFDNERTMPLSRGSAILARLDQYEILEKLGEGGFGAVYLARDVDAGVQRAVKGLPQPYGKSEETLARIRENFALVSRLHHPHIAAALVLQRVKNATYYDDSVRTALRVGPGDLLMVMEYAPGTTLGLWRRQFPDGKVPSDVAVRLVGQVAQALDYAHSRKIVHCDIKPSNIMVETNPDGTVTARLLDFGLAAEVDVPEAAERQDAAGTWSYMAPEQWARSGVGGWTDQYALAVLLFDLLTGTVPFADAFKTRDPMVMKLAVRNNPVVFPRGCPCRRTLARALAKDAAGRFETCEAFIEAAAGELGISLDAHLNRGARRTRIAIAIGVLGAGLAAGLCVAKWLSAPSESDPPLTDETPKVPLQQAVKKEPIVTQQVDTTVLQLRREEQARKEEAERARQEELARKKAEAERLRQEEQARKEEAERLRREEQARKEEAERARREELARQEDAARRAEAEKARREAEEALANAARKAQALLLADRLSRLEKLKQLVREEGAKAKEFRGDVAGIERHLARIDEALREVDCAQPPDKVADADKLIQRMGSLWETVSGEVNWLEANAGSAARAGARRLLWEVGATIATARQRLEADGDLAFDAAKGRYQAGQAYFENGEFEKAVGQLITTRRILSQIWPRLVSRRVEGLVSQAKASKDAGDWSKCAEAARAALALDALSFEADQLLDEARTKLKEP